jgi:anti-sigma factor RsiW
MLQWFSKRGEKSRERRQEALSAYLDGELSAREQTRIEGELAQDAALSEELAELRRTVEMVRSLPTLPVPRSFTLDPAIYGRTRPRRIRLYPVMRAATVLAMVLFVFLTTGNFLFQQAAAPAEDVAMLEAEVPREVEKEVIVVETVEVAREEALEMAAEPAEGEVATEAPVLEAPAPAEPAAETVVEEAEQVAAEAEPADAAVEEMPAAAALPSDLAPSATPTAPSEVGVGAGAPSPSVEASPTPEPTAEAVARVAVESVEAPSPEAVTAVEEPPETPLPEETYAEWAAKTQEHEPEQPQSEQVDWWLVAWWGAGLLGAGLLVVTLLARRFGW